MAPFIQVEGEIWGLTGEARSSAIFPISLLGFGTFIRQDFIVFAFS
jgi:hypothetical protein